MTTSRLYCEYLRNAATYRQSESGVDDDITWCTMVQKWPKVATQFLSDRAAVITLGFDAHSG